MRGSWFTLAAGRRAKWLVFAVWFVTIFIAIGPANLPGKFADAENNEATSYLPESAESTHALDATSMMDSAAAAILSAAVLGSIGCQLLAALSRPAEAHE